MDEYHDNIGWKWLLVDLTSDFVIPESKPLDFNVYIFRKTMISVIAYITKQGHFVSVDLI